jgi:uncharacterized membrane protein
VSQGTDLPRARPPEAGPSARTQIAIAAGAGVAAGVPLAALTAWPLLPLIVWDCACLVYMMWIWATIWRMPAEDTAQRAVRVDPTRRISEVLTLGAAVASLAAVAVVLTRAANSSGTKQDVLAALGLMSVCLSWAVVHTVHTLRYARLYYTGPDGGVDFNQDDAPCFTDFAYLSFTIGMTFQVSDTDLQTREIRRTALLHGLLSYLFGTGIVATTINLIANLGGGGGGGH